MRKSTSAGKHQGRQFQTFMRLAASAGALFVTAGVHATDYTDTVTTSSAASGTVHLVSGDTVTISSTAAPNSYALYVDSTSGYMDVVGTVITQNRASTRAVYVNGLNSRLFMTNSQVYGSNGEFFRVHNGYAELNGVSIFGSANNMTGLYVAASGSLAMQNSTINLTGGGTGLTWIGSGVALGVGNAITITGTGANWAMSLNNVTTIFDSSAQYLPVMQVSSGGLMDISNNSNVIFKGAGSSLSNSTINSGVGINAMDSVITFDGASTGGHEISVVTGTLIFTGNASAANAADTSYSTISTGSDSLFKISGITSSAFRVNRFGVEGSAELGDKDLIFSSGRISGVIVGSGDLVKEGSDADKMEFAGNAGNMSQGFTGNLVLNEGIWRFIGSGTFSTTGNLTQAAGSALSMWANKSYLSLGTATLNGTLDVSGLTGLLGGTTTDTPVDVLLIKTTGGVTASFTGLSAGGVALGSGTDSFMSYGIEYRNAGTELWLKDIDLAWTTAQPNAHGYFNVLTDYSLDYVLEDRAESGSFFAGWDGKSLIKNGEGRLILHRVNLYTGTTRINAGDLTLGSHNGIAASEQVYMAGVSKLNLGNYNQTLNNLTSDTTTTTIYPSVEPDKTVTLFNDRDTEFKGVIVRPSGYPDTATIVKTGTGKLMFSSAHTYTGATRVEAGNLHLAALNAIANSGTVTVDGTISTLYQQKLKNMSGATSGKIILSSHSSHSLVIEQQTGFTGTFAGIIENGFPAAPTVIKQGTGTIVLTGENVYSGKTRIDDGFFVLKDNGSIADSSEVDFTTRSARFDISQSAITQNVKNIIGTGTGASVILGSTDLNLTAAADIFAGVISGDGNVRITGSAADSTYTLSGNNTHTGTTTITSGTLQLGNGGASGSVAGDIVNNTALVLNRSDASAYSGTISGAGTLEKLGSGTVSLTGSNTYTGLTTVSAGALQLGDGGATGSVNGDIVIGNSGNLIINRSDDYIFTGSIGSIGGLGNASQLTQAGPGALTLTRAGSGAGIVNVLGGTMQFAQNGAFNATGAYTTAAGAVTRISGSSTLATGAFTQDAGSTLDITLGATTPVITATQTTLSGTLKVAGYEGGAVSGSASGLFSSRTTIIQSEQNIAGDFTAKTSDAVAPTLDYITLAYGISADLKSYEIGYGLAWYDADLSAASGTFTIATGASFLVDIALNDRTETITSGWDGKALTKLGAGTLTLSASNNYSGSTTVNGGMLNITGWTGSTSQVVIGGAAGTSGTVNVSGYLGSAGNLSVGGSGTGFLTIEGSGSVQSASSNIGGGTYSTGSATVTGSGLWSNTGDINIGSSSRGLLTISGNGIVQADAVHIGRSLGAQGSVTVSGSGSLIARFISLAYQNNGRGYLTITDNGFVSGEAYISDATGGYGSVLIEKSGYWQTNKTYYAGRSGTGILTIADSGSLSVTGGLTVGNGSNSHGTVTVGDSGLLKTTSVFTLGNSGRGILTIEDAATVNAGSIRVAEYASASGILNLAGGLLQTGSLSLGSGTGTINFNSGTLQATKGGTSFISGFSGAKGSMVIQSGGVFIDSRTYDIGVNRNSGFSGVGTLHKLGTGTLTLGGTSTYTGGTEIEAGLLVLATTSASTSSQTIGTGTLAIRAGALAYVSQPSSVSNYTFDNDLSGAGLLDVNLYAASNTLTLTGDTDGFTGTASFRNAIYTLSGGAFNAATLVGNASSTIIVGTGSNQTGNFVFNGGAVRFDLFGSEIRSDGWIDTGVLELKSGNVRVDLAQVTGSSATPLLQQDEGVVRQLINAQSLAGSVSNLNLNGGAISLSSMSSAIQQNSAIVGNTGTVATGYYTVAMTSTGAAGTGTGLYLGSLLTRLDLRSGYTTVLDGDTDNGAGGDEFHAQITGAGNLGIQATDTITLNAANTYTGTTTVFDGALRLGIDGVLGNTARLDIQSGATADINGRAQTLGAFSGSAGSTLLVNSGTVTGSNASIWTIDGLVDATVAESVIQTAGAGMTANISSGTLLLANSSTLALGSGALTIGAGNTGTALLDIQDSQVRSQTAVIGATSGNGRVAISGTGYWNNTGNLQVGSTGAGALTISGSGLVAVGGIYSQNANSMLDLTVENNRGLNDAFITANSATAGGTISVSGFDPGADTDYASATDVLATDRQVLIKTTTGTISGMFASGTLIGFDHASLPDYLYGGIFKADGAKQYLAGVNLSWFGEMADGHGNFTIASGTSFNVDVNLASQNNGPYASGWDGRSLTVTSSNSGTLILSASNTYTGNTTVNSGVLNITGWTGSNESGLINGGTVNVGGFWQAVNHIGVSNTGVLNVASSGTVIADNTVTSASGTINVSGYLQGATVENQSVINVVGTGIIRADILQGAGAPASTTNVSGSGFIDVTDMARIGYYGGNNALYLTDSGSMRVANTLYVSENSHTADNLVSVANTARIDAGNIIVANANTGALAVSGSGVVASAANFTLGRASAGSLNISGSGLVIASGVYSQNANSTLTLDASTRGANDAFIYASSATVGGTLSVGGFDAGTSFASAGAVLTGGKQVLISATNGTITGTFASATLDGFDGAGLPDYLYGGIYKNATSTQYLAGVNLSWLGGVEDGHGDFSVASGTSFNIDVTLADQNNVPYTSGWDGKSLTVTADNSGTLILSESNSFTGGVYIRNGALVAATGTNAAWALGSGTNTVYYDNAAASDARLVFTASATMTQRQIVAANASATLEAASGQKLTVTAAAPEIDGGAVHVYAGGTLNVAGDVTFANNTVSSSGGAIYLEGNAMLANSGGTLVFASNTTSSRGGAIWGGLNAKTGANIIFRDNHAGDLGGAIATYDGMQIGDANTFIGNTAGNGGGAITIGTADMTGGDNLVFTGNVAGGMGGAIHSTYGAITIGTSATFTGNTADSSGGAIYYTGNNRGVTLGSGAVFTSNTAGSGGLGGAIYASGSVEIGASSTFARNYAGSVGGAISAQGNIAIGAGAVIMSNTAGNNGGAIHSQAGNIAIGSSSTLANNTAGGPGGAIYAGNGSFIAGDNIAVLHNTGGAIYAGGSVGVGANALFASNTATMTSGAIYSGGAITIGNSGTFLDNHAGTAPGGAIYAGGAVTIGTDSVFTGNRSATSLGGAITAGGTLTIGANALFTSNTAAVNGGAIYAGSAVNIGSGTFANNYSGTHGGAIYASGNVGIGAGAVFTSNTAAKGTGGAIYSGGNIRIDTAIGGGLRITGNTAGSGGAFAASNDIIINIASSGSLLIANNRAVGIGDGGALHAKNIRIDTAAGSTAEISGNVADSGYGGAFYIADTGAGVALNGGHYLFANNTASNNSGGAISLNSNSSLMLNAGTVSFTGNHAGSGGAIHGYRYAIGGYADALLFTSNTAQWNGGALALGWDDLAVSATTGEGGMSFTGNRAGSLGGAIYGNSGGIKIDAVSAGTIAFTENTSGGDGGAIGIGWGNDIVFSGTAATLLIASNTANRSGGALYSSPGTVGVSGSYGAIDIRDNTATTGSGGAFHAGKGIAINAAVGGTVTISGNTAQNSGGAFYSGSNFVLTLGEGGTLAATGNKAAASDSAGGFLYINSGSMTFDIGANATATIGDANSIAAAADSIAAADATISLTKTGAGALTLWANNTYTGTTFVNAGLLSLRGYLASAHTLVAASSTLAGTGTTAGNVTIQSYGHLAPGASPGQLTILGNLALENNAQLDWELGAPTTDATGTHMYHSGTNDLVIVGNGTPGLGNVMATGTSYVNITTTATLAKGEYDLINYTGTLGGDAANFAIGTVSGDADANLDKYKIVTSETNWIKLTYDLGGGYTYWDGGESDHWSTAGIDGGGGNWYAPGIDGAYTAWTGSQGALPNGEWEQGGFAIFRGAPGIVTVVNSGTTIEFSGAQFKTDGYLLTGGTLTTSGTGAVVLNIDDLGVHVTTTIATTITGTHDIEKAGAGTLVLAGTNTHTGTTHILTGTLVMANERALGENTATIAAGATLRVATGSMTFSNTLAGSGLLEIDLASPDAAFSFSLQSFSPSVFFTGTALFNNSAFTLDNNALAGADAILGTNNTTTVATGTQQLGNLTIDGAALAFAYTTGTQADGIIRTGTLNALGGTVTVNATGSAGFSDKPLLQQDEGALTRLIEATAVTGTNLTLAGGATATAAIKNTSTVTTATATYTQALDYTGDDLSIAYKLTQLDLLANQTTTLSGDTTGDGADMKALITGAGTLEITATNAITLNNAANTYTGTTLVTTGTLISGTNNALGQTAWLAVTSTAAYNLNGYTQTIKGGQIAGSLLGTTGSLGLDGSVTITSANSTFGANAGVTGTTTLRDTQALGATGTLFNSQLVQLDGATGAFSKTLDGSGTLALINSSTVTISGTNTNYNGAFAIGGTSRLIATTSENLGAAGLSGTGVFEKQDAATTLTIARDNNAFTGTTLVTGGTLRLDNLLGTGSSAVINNAILDLSGTGAFANNISGTGTTAVTGAGVNLTGTNQTAWDITGSGTVSGTHNLGAGNTHIDGLLVARASSPWVWSNTLTGTGTLAINLSGSAFTFSSSAFSHSAFFEGVLALENVAYNLAHNTANESALASATLRTLAGSVINLGTNSAISGSMKINNLELIGGTINVHLQGPDAAHVLEVNELIVTNADSVSFNLLDVTLPPEGAPVAGNFLDQDSGTNSIQLIKAASVDAPYKQMELLFNGVAPNATGTTLIVNDGYSNIVEATYDYVAFSSGSAYSHDAHEVYGPGVYVDYLLKQLKTNTNLVLDNGGGVDTTMGALITGTGNLTIQAHDTQITLSHSNSYSGTTTITSGTLIAGAIDALGQTSYLVITNTAALDILNHTQTIADGAQIDGSLFGSGSLGLGGLATITSTNTNFAANVGVTGTTLINNTDALGRTGTLAIAGNAALQTASASGTFFKTLGGTGAFELLGTSTIALTATNTAYSGTFAISATSRLIAETTENLGAANLSGSGVFEKQNADTNITITHANTAFTGSTIITGGTLTLTDLGGVGTGDILNNAALDLAATGTLVNNITGTGTSYVSSGSHGFYTVLTGTNQTAWHITGAAQVTTTENLGNGSTHIDGTLDIDSDTAWLYTNTLTGTGILKVDTDNNALDFQLTSVGNAFAGTLELHNATFNLAGENTAALANATLQLDAGSHTTVGTGTQQIGNLTLNGGRLDFGVTIPADVSSSALISTNTLAVATGTVGINLPGLDIDTAVDQLPLLQQDEGNGVQLIASATTIGNPNTGLQLVDITSGSAITNPQSANINQSGTTVATGTYDYGLAATGSNGSGLYATYQLKAVDIHDGKTLALSQDAADPAGADDFTAVITGDGSLLVEANGSITLKAENAYTGTTTVATGTLVAGADNALGQTDQLHISTGAAFDLNGKTQTIANGGQIDGSLAGSGTLTLAAGTMTITTSNTTYTADTHIATAATAHLTEADGLGASSIQLDGALRVSNTTDGTLQNTLTGTGTLIKDNTGAVTINHANTGFSGTAEIASGRLTAAKIDSLGDADITVAANATFEQLDITGTLQNTLAGTGTHQLTNTALTIDNAARYAIAHTALDTTSALILAADHIALGNLRLNGGWLAFDTAHPSAAATIAALGNTAGNILINADMAALTANHLTIVDDGAGTHSVYVNDHGTQPLAPNLAIEVISTGNGTANFVMANPGGKLEYDLTAVELVRGDNSIYTPDTNKWYLSDRNLSHAADAIINTASTLAIDWAYAMDAIHLRLDDLRMASIATGGLGGGILASPEFGNQNQKSNDLWMRVRGYRLNAGNTLSNYSFKQYGWGVTAGADKAFATETGLNLLGGFIDMGGVDRQFDNDGNGKTHTVGAGIYATLFKNGGWFLDAIARLDRYSNEFEAKAYDGKQTRGKYTNKSQGLSIEAGRHLRRANGWWLEPGVQVSVLWLNGVTYKTQPEPGQRALKVRVGDTETWQTRALVRFGRQIPDSRWQPYGKFAMVAVDSSGGKVTSLEKSFKTDYDGKRFEAGFGAMYRIDAISQIYLDYEYAKAQAYERPWSLNLGYRRLW